MELASHFQKFLSNIEPTPTQKSEASTGHTTLRSRLEKDSNYSKYFVDSFISGSYGRDTAIRPINDVDVIVITNHNDSWTPDAVLYVLEKALGSYYPSDKLIRQGRSVRVSLSYVIMDVVPAILTNGLNGVLKIPDREVKEWKVSHPRKHLQLATEMNSARDNLYKPLVKALKQWRDNMMEDSWKPKSFLLECLVYDYALKNNISSVPKAIKEFFWYTKAKYSEHRKTNSYSPVISDPAGTGNDIAKKWSYSDFCRFMDELDKSWYNAYLALEASDYNDSAEKWRKLLGDVFPLSV